MTHIHSPLRAISITAVLWTAIILGGCSESEQEPPATDGFEEQIAEYIQRFPYQDTYKYMMAYTGGDASKLNTWVIGSEPALIKAGEDLVVRTNNDTFYKSAIFDLSEGPAVLASSAPSEDRFSSFQLMDDRNANYRNVIHPSGTYTLYYGEQPAELEGEGIEVPSRISLVIVRVEVKDMNDTDDVAAAERVFNGITVDGPTVDRLPEVDLLSEFDESVSTEALRRLDEAFANMPFTQTIVGPGQEPGRDVPYLNHSAGTKGGWGGPHPSHSAYDVVFVDVAGETLVGANGTYTITTEAPPVRAFWSITVYDTGRGGFLHPNKDDRYHINNTTAVENTDGTFTFTFKQTCEEGDLNCLAVPAGPFDLAMRYYLPSDDIIRGSWTMPRPQLQPE
jgi:hypothetical protein